MKYESQDFTLKNGRVIAGSFGILGIDRKANEISSGYDNYIGEKSDFSPSERKEISEYMIELWKEWGK